MWNNDIAECARVRSFEVTELPHIGIRPDGRSWGTVLDDRNIGWIYGSESGYARPDFLSVLEDMKGQENHVLLNSNDYSEAGISCYIKNGMGYWMLLYAKTDGEVTGIVTDSNAPDYVKRLFKALNQDRAEKGLQPLRWDGNAGACAQNLAYLEVRDPNAFLKGCGDISGELSKYHVSYSTGTTMYITVDSKSSANVVGEGLVITLARRPEEVFSGNKDTYTDPIYSRVGIGCYEGPDSTGKNVSAYFAYCLTDGPVKEMFSSERIRGKNMGRNLE